MGKDGDTQLKERTLPWQGDLRTMYHEETRSLWSSTHSCPALHRELPRRSTGPGSSAARRRAGWACAGRTTQFLQSHPAAWILPAQRGCATSGTVTVLWKGEWPAGARRPKGSDQEGARPTTAPVFSTSQCEHGCFHHRARLDLSVNEGPRSSSHPTPRCQSSARPGSPRQQCGVSQHARVTHACLSNLLHSPTPLTLTVAAREKGGCLVRGWWQHTVLFHCLSESHDTGRPTSPALDRPTQKLAVVASPGDVHTCAQAQTPALRQWHWRRWQWNEIWLPWLPDASDTATASEGSLTQQSRLWSPRNWNRVRHGLWMTLQPTSSGHLWLKDARHLPGHWSVGCLVAMLLPTPSVALPRQHAGDFHPSSPSHRMQHHLPSYRQCQQWHDSGSCLPPASPTFHMSRSGFLHANTRSSCPCFPVQFHGQVFPQPSATAEPQQRREHPQGRAGCNVDTMVCADLVSEPSSYQPAVCYPPSSLWRLRQLSFVWSDPVPRRQLRQTSPTVPTLSASWCVSFFSEQSHSQSYPRHWKSQLVSVEDEADCFLFVLPRSAFYANRNELCPKMVQDQSLGPPSVVEAAGRITAPLFLVKAISRLLANPFCKAVPTVCLKNRSGSPLDKEVQERKEQQLHVHLRTANLQKQFKVLNKKRSKLYQQRTCKKFKVLNSAPTDPESPTRHTYKKSSNSMPLLWKNLEPGRFGARKRVRWFVQYISCQRMYAPVDSFFFFQFDEKKTFIQIS